MNGCRFLIVVVKDVLLVALLEPVCARMLPILALADVSNGVDWRPRLPLLPHAQLLSWTKSITIELQDEQESQTEL